MQEITIGEIIKYLRIEKGYSKSALCYGLCSITALSRYEEGIRNPDIFLLDALLQRLGTDIRQYDLLIDNNDYFIMKQRKILKECLNTQCLYQIHTEINNYKDLIKHSKNLHDQFIYYILSESQYMQMNYDESLSLINTALGFTECKYDIMDSALFTVIELRLINLLAKNYFQKQEFKTALPIYESILKYLRNNILINRSLKELYYDCLYDIARINFRNQNLGLAHIYIEEIISGYSENFFLKNCQEILELKLKIDTAMGTVSDSLKEEADKKILALSLITKDFYEKMNQILEDESCQSIISHL